MFSPFPASLRHIVIPRGSLALVVILTNEAGRNLLFVGTPYFLGFTKSSESVSAFHASVRARSESPAATAALDCSMN